MKHFVLLVSFAGLCAGCHNNGSHPSAPFILGVDVDINRDTNDTTAIVKIDSRLFGALSLKADDGTLLSTYIVLASGSLDLGVLPAGKYNLVLDGYQNDTHAPAGTDNVEFELFALPIPPPEPTPDPEPTPGTPTLTCNANEDGGAAIIIDLNGVSVPKILRRLDDPDGDIMINQDDVVLDIPLRPGTYTFTIIDPDTRAELARCDVVIPKDDDEGDDHDPHFDRCDLDHNGEVSDCERLLCDLDHHKKYVIRHRDGKGHCHEIVVDWHALLAHICKHGDELGCAVHHHGKKS